jgi:hypothetical protein
MTIDQFSNPTHTADLIPRDRYGRPLIKPEDGGKPVAYTRVSTLAKVLDDKTALTKWMQRQVVIGMGKRPDLVAKASAVTNDKEIGSIVESAMAAAESERAANIGTAVHAWTEQVDDGADIDTFPADYRADLVAYKEAMSQLEIRAKELFVVTDKVTCAGTFDRLVRLPDGRTMVADIKTGRTEPAYPLGATTQIAIYSRGHLYTDERGRYAHLPSAGVDQDHGLLIHLPATQGKCDLYLLDLQTGWKLARIASSVKQTFSDKKQFIQPFTV